MKFRTILLFSMSLVLMTSCSNEKTIKLPLTFQEGYGPFESSMTGISPYSNNENDPWKKTHLKTSGIPKDWTDVKIGAINTDIYQFVYQNYYLGNITKERYKELQKSWNWVPDSLNLSKKPIKCNVAFAQGKDSIGELKIIVDANNNYDFSDDKTFKPIEVNLQDKINKDSLVKSNGIKVNFEQLSNDKIIQVSVPLLIVYLKQYNRLMSNFAQYATTKLDGEEIAILSNDFTDLSYNNLGIIKISNLDDNGEKVDNQRERVVAKNEYIEIENNIYKNLGIKKNENILALKKMDLPKKELPSKLGNSQY